jgi:Carboxypeptidase regulatory-like domain
MAHFPHLSALCFLNHCGKGKMRMFEEKKGRCLALASIVLVFSFNLVFAQSSTGTLRGQVQDVLGGLVVGGTVTATDAAGVGRTATTDDEGRYAFAGLPPGRYTLLVESPGFET